MNGRAIVFLGPSLPKPEARRVLNADFFPPARKGDIVKALRYGPSAIGLIDGRFETCGSVWHKELLFALEMGIPVYGAASMGALRAAELASFGMIGVGQIYEQYRSGDLDFDDAVAVLHGDSYLAHAPLTDPYVNIVETVANARRRGIISDASFDHAVSHARRTFFHERTLAGILDSLLTEATGRIRRELMALREAVPDSLLVDLKKQDALSLLQRIRDDLANKSAPTCRPHMVYRSTFLRNLLDDSNCRALDPPVGITVSVAEQKAAKARLLGSAYRYLVRFARLLGLCDAVAYGTGQGARFGLRWFAGPVPPDFRARAEGVEALCDLAYSKGKSAKLARYLSILEGQPVEVSRQGATQPQASPALIRQHLLSLTAILWLPIASRAAEMGLAADPDSVQLFSDSFRRSRDLLGVQDFERWLMDVELDLESYAEFCRESALLFQLTESDIVHFLGSPVGVDNRVWLLDAMHLSGLYSLSDKIDQERRRFLSDVPASDLVYRFFGYLGESCPGSLDAYAQGIDFVDGEAGLVEALQIDLKEQY